ncbi:MAG: hypothetical protein PHI85_06050 [Victivallaceae bacterium]|nr:hypothetical protein [Victivallaceae bacterium]
MMRAAKSWPLGVMAAMLLIAAMTAAAERFGRHELFFPELLAMAMGCLWMEARPWRTNRVLMVLSLVAGGWLGYALSLTTWPGTAGKIIIGYAICGVWLAGFRINVTPMLSACLLPLLIGGATWLYPLAITVEMTALAGCEQLFERYGLRRKTGFIPVEGSFCLRLCRWGLLTAMLALLLYPARLIGGFAAAPPLIVGFSAFADLDRPARRHLPLGIFFCAAAAALGVGGRRLGLYFDLPAPLTVALLTAALALLCRGASYFLPPCAAAMLLAFLIPESGLTVYLWQLPSGAALLLGGGRLFSLIEEKAAMKKMRRPHAAATHLSNGEPE